MAQEHTPNHLDAAVEAALQDFRSERRAELARFGATARKKAAAVETELAWKASEKEIESAVHNAILKEVTRLILRKTEREKWPGDERARDEAYIHELDDVAAVYRRLGAEAMNSPRFLAWLASLHSDSIVRATPRWTLREVPGSPAHPSFDRPDCETRFARQRLELFWAEVRKGWNDRSVDWEAVYGAALRYRAAAKGRKGEIVSELARDLGARAAHHAQVLGRKPQKDSRTEATAKKLILEAIREMKMPLFANEDSDPPRQK